MWPSLTASSMLPPTKPRLVKLLERITRNSIPAVLCGIVILILTGLPGSAFPRVKPALGIDKMVHFGMYATFAFLCIWGYRKQYIKYNKTYRTKALKRTCIVSIAFGGITELMQEYLVPTRTGDWFDFIADSIGTLIGISIFWLFYHRKK